jgi:hypothetical protein
LRRNRREGSRQTVRSNVAQRSTFGPFAPILFGLPLHFRSQLLWRLSAASKRSFLSRTVFSRVASSSALYSAVAAATLAPRLHRIAWQFSRTSPGPAHLISCRTHLRPQVPPHPRAHTISATRADGWFLPVSPALAADCCLAAEHSMLFCAA